MSCGCTHTTQQTLLLLKFLSSIFLLSNVSFGQGPEIDSLDLDLDDMWDNAIWEEIVEVGEEDVFEVENITATAGVRGAEAEDEALYHLYYRRSMKGPSRHELMEAYGKLRNKVDKLREMDDNHSELEKLNSYIKHLEKKIKV